MNKITCSFMTKPMCKIKNKHKVWNCVRFSGPNLNPEDILGSFDEVEISLEELSCSNLYHVAEGKSFIKQIFNFKNCIINLEEYESQEMHNNDYKYKYVMFYKDVIYSSATPKNDSCLSDEEINWLMQNGYVYYNDHCVEKYGCEKPVNLVVKEYNKCEFVLEIGGEEQSLEPEEPSEVYDFEGIKKLLKEKMGSKTSI